MELTQQMIKQAVANLADFTPMAKTAAEKVALTPAVGGQVAPPPAAPPMGGAPMDPSMGGMPPGAPPMDPAMMGGMPPGAPPMDPAMMDPSMGGAPMDPGMMDPSMGPPPDAGAPALDTETNKAQDDQDGDGKPDVMVPLRAITEHTVGVIEATKGRRTADAAPPKAPGAGGAGGAEGPQSPIASLGGAPGATPMSLPGLGPKQASARIEALIQAARKVR